MQSVKNATNTCGSINFTEFGTLQIRQHIWSVEIPDINVDNGMLTNSFCV